MLTDASAETAIIIAAVMAGGCLLICAAALLLCLTCPACPLRTAVAAAFKQRRSNEGRKLPLHKRHPAAAGCLRCCRCCIDVDEQARPEPSAPDRRFDLQVANSPGALGGGPAFHQQMQQTQSRSQQQQEEQMMESGLRLSVASAPPVTLTFSVTRQPDCVAVHLHSAEGTPGPRLGLCHCNFAQAQLLTTEDAIDDAVRTAVVGQTASPVFNETLVLPLTEADGEAAEAVRLQVQCLDFDRFSRERIVGEALLPLPQEIGLTVQYSCLPMRMPQTESSELLVALRYIPAAERLDVMLLKACDIRAPGGAVPATYLHLALLSGGSAAPVFKKRTRIFDASPRPVYNESVSIDLPRRRLDRVSLIVSVMSCSLERRRVRLDLDVCLGFVVFSSSCYGRGRAHWDQMVNRPGAALAYWHQLS